MGMEGAGGGGVNFPEKVLQKCTIQEVGVLNFQIKSIK